MKVWFNRLIQFFNKNHSKPATYFVHIPKTAGTSFIVLLDRFFAADKIFPQQLWRETKNIEVKKNAKYDLYRGHFGGGGVGVLTQRDLAYLTILRDPIDLAHSTYQFVKRESNTKVHQLVEENNMSFADFLAHPMTASLVRNRMIRNISFDFVNDPAAQEVFLSAETIEFLQTIIQNNKPALDDDQRLQRAKKFIQQSRWFGLLARFDESLQLLCFAMHWPPMGQTQKLNTFKKTTDLTAKERHLINQLNQQDKALYKFSLELFEQRLVAMKKQLKLSQKHSSQTVDELLDQRYQQHHSQQVMASLPTHMEYGFEQVLLGSQWHRRELLHPENEYFRWTGPGFQASIDCWLKPLEYQLSIRIINATSVELLDQLSISINGHPVIWQTSDIGLVRVLTMTCAAEMVKANGLVRVTLGCQTMISHAQAFESDDERLVGVAVHWLKFSYEAE